MFSISKKGWIVFFIILILSILNPSYSDFKEYTGLNGKSAEHLHKKYNFLICSIFENDKNDKKYLAILMNFIDITSNKKDEDNLINSADSTMVIDTTSSGLPAPPAEFINGIEAADSNKSDSEFVRHFKNTLEK